MSPSSSLVLILNNDLSNTFPFIKRLNPALYTDIYLPTTFTMSSLVTVYQCFFTQNTEYMYIGCYYI